MSIEVNRRIVEPLFGWLVGVSSLGTSKYEGGPPAYAELLDGVEGRAILTDASLGRMR